MTSRRILAALALLCVLTPRQSKASDFVSVMDYAAQYGCVPGDYTTACQDAFDAAILAVQTFSQSGDDTLSYSGTVHVPAAAGCFRITAPINMLQGVSLVGEGGLGSCILADDTDALRYTYASGYGQPQVSNILLYGCRWDTGTSACLPPTAARTGIIRPQTAANADADSQYGLLVQNTLIWGFDTAIDVTTVRNLWLTNSYFQNVNTCVTFAGLGWSARIEGLQCTRAEGDGLGSVGDGIVAIPYTYDAGSTIGTKGPESVKVDQSHIHGFRNAIWSKAGAFTTITKSDIQATVNGIRFSDVFGGYIIRDNYIGMDGAANEHGIWGEGIAASYQDSHQTVIEGNVLVATGATTATCIQINESGTTNQDNVNIRSNQCLGFKAYDLDAFNPGAMTVSDNFFKSTPVTGSIRIGTRRTGVIKVEKNETASTITATTASDVTNGYVRFCNNVRGGSTLDGCDIYTPTIRGTMTAGAINAGAISGSTFNNIQFPIPASTAVLTLGSGKTLTVSNTLTFNGTDGSSMAFGGGGTVAYLSNTLNAFAPTTSAQLASVMSDETGTGSLVFGNSPTIATPVINGLPTGTGVATANTASTLVARDGSGNFAAGTITASLSGNATSATSATTATNATTLGGATFASPGAIGSGTPSSIVGTTINGTSVTAATHAAVSTMTFQTNGMTAGSIAANGKWSLGTQAPTATNAPLLDINQTSTVKAGPEASGLRILQSGTGANLLLEGYGGGSGNVSGFSALGTVGSPLALTSGSFIVLNRGLGWDGSAWGNAGSAAALYGVRASQDQSPGHHGSEFLIAVTPNDSTTRANALLVQNSGGVSVGATAIATDPGIGSMNLSGGFASAAPTTKTANYSATVSDGSLIFNGAGSLTLTLLSAASYRGRWLLVKTIAAQTVVSASSNVVPQAGGAAATAILAATAGKWAWLQSDGTNWQIMASN